MKSKEEKELFNIGSKPISETSEEGTLWDRSLCPLFGGCPFLGGWSLYSVLSHNMNSGDLQHPNNGYSGYCKRCFMLGDLLLCEGLPCLQESVGACKRGGFTSHTGTNKCSGQARSCNRQRRYFCRPCPLQPGSQTVAVFNSLPSSGYGRASTASTAELVDSLGVSGHI